MCTTWRPREIGGGTLVFHPIEGLTREELEGGHNYLTLMEENLSNLRLALKCK
jgi:zinc transport system substrate-binding protein